MRSRSPDGDQVGPPLVCRHGGDLSISLHDAQVEVMIRARRIPYPAGQAEADRFRLRRIAEANALHRAGLLSDADHAEDCVAGRCAQESFDQARATLPEGVDGNLDAEVTYNADGISANGEDLA